jgi:pyruvate kinase
LQWAVRQSADYVALSFVRRAEDCVEAKSLIKAAGGRAPLVAKIEKAEAIQNLSEIVAASDGVMVARGDLGVETSVEHVPVYQKRIIEEANRAGRFVITATQMLQSMVSEPRPTRAEASDVANAVWDGSDALMLSGETATGQYPVAAVATMSRIIESAEAGQPAGSSSVSKWVGKQSGRVSRAICEAAAFAADEMNAKVVAVFTESGLMARRLAALRLAQRVVALTTSRDVRNELSLIWGVETHLHTPSESTRDLLQVGDRVLLEAGVVQQGQIIVVMAGRLSGMGLSSSMALHAVGEDMLPPHV